MARIRHPIEDLCQSRVVPNSNSLDVNQSSAQEATLIKTPVRLARGVLLSGGRVFPVGEGDMYLPDSDHLSLSSACNKTSGPEKNTGGRPRKNPSELGRASSYDRISLDLKKLKETTKSFGCEVTIRASFRCGDITRQVQLKLENGSTEIQETEEHLEVIRDPEGEITTVLSETESGAFYRQKLYRTALWKTQHNVSDLKLRELLGFKRGINFMVKAPAVISYLNDISIDIQRSIRVIPILMSVKNKLVTGVVTDPVSLVHYVVRHVLSGTQTPLPEEIHLVIQGDGRSSSRRCPFTLVTLAVVVKAEDIHTPSNLYTIGLLNASETHEVLKIIFDHLNPGFRTLSLEGLLLNDRFHRFILHVSGDWKFLASLLGNRAANSRYFCIWCTCQKLELTLSPEELDVSTLQRKRLQDREDTSNEESCTSCILNKKERMERGFKDCKPNHGLSEENHCLIDSRAFSLVRTWPDVLHAGLRLTDPLEKKITQNAKTEQKQDEITEQIFQQTGIRWTHYPAKEGDSDLSEKWTSLSGTEKRQILGRITDLSFAFQHNDEALLCVRTMKLLGEILDYLGCPKSDHDKCRSDPLKSYHWITTLKDLEDSIRALARADLELLGDPSSVYFHTLIPNVPQMKDLHSAPFLHSRALP